MRQVVMIAAALTLLAGTPVAHAQKLDAKGKCHDASGKFAKAEVCKGAGGAAPVYKLDAKGNCHGPKGKMAKKEMCAAGAR